MNKIYMIDGYGGSPAINWLDTEAHKLKEYFEVEKVHITDPTIANVVDWDKDLDEVINGADDAYFICHSLGCISLLRYLARNQVSPKGCLFVSPFEEPVEEFPEFDEYFEGVDIQKLSYKLQNSLVISAENDGVIPWQHSQTVAQKLHLPFVLLPEGNHFRASDGIVEFPRISDFAIQNWKK